MNPFERFSRSFLEILGAPYEVRDGRLYATLAGPLAAHYGRESLVLTFRPHDAEGDLVAYGSHAFEEMQVFLASRGRLAACRLPERGEPGPMPRAVRGTLSALPPIEHPRRYVALNYHLSFLSDERREAMYSCAFDLDGHPAPEALAWLEATPAAEPLEAAFAPPPGVIEQAERLAFAEAEQLAQPIEREVLGRLQRVAERLVGYYDELVRDLPVRRRKGQSEDEALEAADEERWALRRELERKLGEETARHQLRVQVRLVSLAAFEVPGSERWFVLNSGRRERRLGFWENRHTQEAAWPACERCGTQGPAYGLCEDAHLVCQACLERCKGCDTDRCSAELTACHHCGEASCEACMGGCATGHRVCAVHLTPCVCCGQVYCPSCGGQCPDCPDGRAVARAHAAPCAVCQAPTCAGHRRSCALCGAANCRADHVACPGCGDGVCATHMARCAHCELPYCARCRDEGTACRACGVVGHAGSAPAAWLEALAQVPQAGRYDRWNGIENDRYRYLLGHGLLGDLLVVTDASGTLVRVKEIGFWQKLFGWLG